MKTRPADPLPVVSQPAWLSHATVWAILGLLPLLAVSRQSYWIDEALTALKAAQPTLGDWWRMMVAERLSDLQMPLYMIYAREWGQLFGTTEWVLRAANLPWFVGGAAVFVFSFAGQARLFAALVVTLSSFAWFYLDEARPYGMQLGASLMVTGALRRLLPLAEQGVRLPRAWLGVLGLGLVALAGSSLLGMFWAAAMLVVAGVLGGRRGLASFWRDGRGVCLVLAGALGALAVYYVWTLIMGARASPAVVKPWQGAAWIAYELLGFGGLGPGRLAIRAGGLGAFYPYLLPLAVYGLLLAAMLQKGWRFGGPQERRAGLVTGGIGLGALMVLLAAGWLLEFRLLGRHCAPLWAAAVLGLTRGCAAAWGRATRGSRLLVVVFLVACAVSCLSVRLAARHLKDDYRSAAARARAALDGGWPVWWCADVHGAAVYGLALGDGRDAGRAVCVLNPSRSGLAELPEPKLVVVSKPDLYDRFGALAQWLEANRFNPGGALPAFTLWVAPGVDALPQPAAAGASALKESLRQDGFDR